MNFLAQRTVLITGASSGLGAEFARQLAPVSKTLILAARRLDRLEALRDEIERPGLTIHCRQVDLADHASLEEFVSWLTTLSDPVDFLLNNAGLGDHGAFSSSDWERVRQMIEVNIGALTRLTHALVPVLERRPHAAILNVSSVASFLPIPRMAIYAATKAYVTSFSEALRAELRHTGVRVVTLCPGPVPTEFSQAAQRAVNPDPRHTPDEVKVSARQVVAEALQAVENDRPRVVPGWMMKALVFLLALTPMLILRMVMNREARR